MMMLGGTGQAVSKPKKLFTRHRRLPKDGIISFMTWGEGVEQ